MTLSDDEYLSMSPIVLDNSMICIRFASVFHCSRKHPCVFDSIVCYGSTMRTVLLIPTLHEYQQVLLLCFRALQKAF